MHFSVTADDATMASRKKDAAGAVAAATAPAPAPSATLSVVNGKQYLVNKEMQVLENRITSFKPRKWPLAKHTIAKVPLRAATWRHRHRLRY